ncbi:uncharacterized protein LOC134782793 [Penaeus indicus]|uniref:uncharacterized protein LOC134782793 n=1 Tax=Penaeus indicus TaxID=29960 RepID=UPI00300C145D
MKTQIGEESESGSNESAMEYYSDVDYDCVLLVDISLDSDEPLTEYARRQWDYKDPRIPFVWSGITASRGHRMCTHTLTEMFNSLFPEELFRAIEDETNRYRYALIQ